MTDGLLAIGAFSRATMLSIKALRSYHEAGILIPARVDPATGYRSYHTSQLIDAAGPSGALYPPEIPDDDADDIEAFIPIAGPERYEPERSSPVVLSEVAAARVAVLVHAGPYDTIDDTYRHLGAWVAAHASPATRPIREHYTVSYDQTDDPEEFLTEISWPIAGDPDPDPDHEE